MTTNAAPAQNIFWCIATGIWLTNGDVVASIQLFIPVIGVPIGWAVTKLIPVSLMPLGPEIVDSDRLMTRILRSQSRSERTKSTACEPR